MLFRILLSLHGQIDNRMDRHTIEKLGNVPFDLSILQTIYPDCKHISDKARQMEADGQIVRLKRGLYVARHKEGLLSEGLIANHLYGPSYVSRSWALRFYGLIPERVHLVQSMTIKHTRRFSNSIGDFDYQSCPADYFPIGIRTEGEADSRFLIATPEKALCDYICHHPMVTLRFMKEVGPFLEEDLRFDMDTLSDLNLDLIRQCAERGRKSGSLFTLLKFLQHERLV